MDAPSTEPGWIAAGLPVADRQLDVREPEIVLRDLAGHVRRPRRRVRRQVHRPQLPHPGIEHRHPPGPTDPLRDHRRRHGRGLRQQPADPRLDLIHGRPGRCPPVPRRASAASLARTVFFEIPNCRAICLIGIRSATCSRRISAQSSTLNIPSVLLARSGGARIGGGGQFSGDVRGSAFHTSLTCSTELVIVDEADRLRTAGPRATPRPLRPPRRGSDPIGMPMPRQAAWTCQCQACVVGFYTEGGRSRNRRTARTPAATQMLARARAQELLP